MFTGEKLTKEEAKGLMNELCDPEDAEGFTPFMRKLNKFYTFIAIWLQKEPNIYQMEGEQQKDEEIKNNLNLDLQLSWKGCARTTLHKQFLNETKHKRWAE